MRKSWIILIVLFVLAVLVGVTRPTPAAVENPAPATVETATPQPTASPAPDPTLRPVIVTGYKDPEAERILWELLSERSPSDAVTAGIMAYFWRESFFRSDAVAGWAASEAYTGVDHCAAFTVAIDAGLEDGSTREEFIRRAHDQYGGYGLGQWSSEHYTTAFYDFAQSWGTSIADAEMQVAFTIESMRQNERLWSQLCETDDPYHAGWLIGVYYDGSAGAEGIAQLAKSFYERWTG